MALGETGTNSIPAFPFSGFFVVLSLKWGDDSMNSTPLGRLDGFLGWSLQLEKSTILLSC